MMAEIVHVVLARWSATAPDHVRETARTIARSLAHRIPGIIRLDEGPSVSPEQLEGGYDYALAVRFRDAASRDAYLPHPAHQELVEVFQTALETVVVFDIAAQ